MKILEEEEDDDDKASLDDILRELCLLRCSTCKTSVCSPKSDTSYTKDILKELNLVKNDQETAPVKTQDELVPDEDPGFESEIETHGVNSTTESTEELSCQNEESVRDCNEGSVESIEYLLRDGCTSQDCGCIKPTRTVSDIYLESNQRHYTLESKESKKVPGCLLKNVSSQTKETSFELKITGLTKLIKSQENLKFATKKSDTSIPVSLQCNPDSSYSSGDSFHTLPDNFYNPKPFSSFGCDRDSLMSRAYSIRDSTKTRHSIIMDIPFEPGSSNGSKNRNHMVDTYEKLLHKIERLKKMASWKTKKRKKKSKYSLQGSNEHKPSTLDQPRYLEEKREFKVINKAEVVRCEIGVQSDSTLLIQRPIQNHTNQSGDIAALQKMINKDDDSSSLILHSISQTPEERGELSSTPATQMSQNGRCCRVKETDDEILTHLKHINKLLEDDSCAGCLVQRENSMVNYQDLRNCKTTSKSSRLLVERKDRRKPDKNKQVKVLWAVTKVTVYPDSCRTYEVMRLSRKRPHKVPSSSDTVFVLLPNK